MKVFGGNCSCKNTKDLHHKRGSKNQLAAPRKADRAAALAGQILALFSGFAYACQQLFELGSAVQPPVHRPASDDLAVACFVPRDQIAARIGRFALAAECFDELVDIS